MASRTWLSVLVVGLCAGISQGAEPTDDASAALRAELKQIEAAIADAPDDPMGYCLKAQCQMKLGEYDAGYQTAREAKRRAIRGKSTLPWMRLEELDLGTVRVMVRMNLGPKERRPPEEFGIARPVSFIVHKDGRREAIDYEIGYAGGKPSTAALGMMQVDGAHANFGMIELDASYETIRAQALGLIKKRYKPEPVKRPAEKEYLNIRMPAGVADFTPIVLAASPQKTIVAYVGYVDGKRDVQVIERSDSDWQFVGKRGRALTGAGGTFLQDAKQGPDGRLWVLVSYTRPSNREKGNNAFLYCFEEGAWRLAESEAGHPAADFDDRGLRFLGANEPAHHQLISHPVNDSFAVWPHLSQLIGKQWVSHPLEKLLRETRSQPLGKGGDFWLVAVRAKGDTTQVVGYQLDQPMADKPRVPHLLTTLPSPHYLYGAALLPKNRLAVLLKEKLPEDQRDRKAQLVGYLVDVTEPDDPQVEETARPPCSFAEHFECSPTGELVLTDCSSSTVKVYALREGTWQEIARASQSPSDGFIFSPRLFFHSDGRPIVTWEDFFPH